MTEAPSMVADRQSRAGRYSQRERWLIGRGQLALYYLEYLKTNLRHVVNWLRVGSMWPLTFGLACCAIELLHSVCSRYDIERFGCLFRGTPRQSELLISAGTVTPKMAPTFKKLQEFAIGPNYTIHMDSCTGWYGH